MSFKGKDIISIGDLSKEEILFILDEADKLKKDFIESNGDKCKNLLAGKKMISAFFEDSTRTRTSFIEAITQLGGSYQGFAGAAGTSINKGESMYHTVKMLENYGADIVVMRHFLDGAPKLLSERLTIPVINAGDGNHEHPTQTLLDLFTIKETQGRLDNLTIALVGDLKYGRTVHSLLMALSLFPNNRFYLVGPRELSMPENFLNILKQRNTPFTEMDNLQQAVDNSDIVYMTRIQKERLPDDIKILYDKLKKMFRLKASMLDNVKKNLKILHPLPIPKQVQEITSDVEATKYCYYFEQAKNGLYVRMTLLCLVLGTIPSAEFSKNQDVVEKTNFDEVNILQKSNPHKKIGDIVNGVLIDHLPSKSAIDIIKIMGYNTLNNVFLGINLESSKYGRKDIIKIESDNFDLEDLESLNKLALICPTATINLIKGRSIIRKGKVRLPSEFYNILICPNANCISRPEHFETDLTKFTVLKRDPLSIECQYCGTVFDTNKIVFRNFNEE